MIIIIKPNKTKKAMKHVIPIVIGALGMVPKGLVWSWKS